MSLTLLWTIILAVLSLTLVLAFIRLVRGPSLPDRVVALDLAVALAMGIIAVYSVTFNKPAFLDVAIIIALISFLGTVAFAYYLERRA